MLTTVQPIFQCYELEVKYKRRIPQRHKISNSLTAYNFFKTIWASEKIEWVEEMLMICLNRANGVIAFYRISQGGTTGTVVDPKIIFQIAISCGASSIMICHNHPSGNLKASEQDICFSKQLKQAGQLLEIIVLDSMIITADGYFSLADEGMM